MMIQGQCIWTCFFVEPLLLSDGILNTVVFQQDGALCHCALIVRDYLNRTFPNHWIGHGRSRLWAARSPDLTPLIIFFCLGFYQVSGVHWENN